MINPLLSMLGGIVHCLNTAMMGHLLGSAVARVFDDLKRNRATRRRLKEAGFRDPEHGPHAPGRTITRLD